MWYFFLQKNLFLSVEVHIALNLEFLVEDSYSILYLFPLFDLSSFLT